MANRSSTSSSDLPPIVGRVPWAFLVAVLILAGVELGVRLAPAEKVIPYRGGMQEHFAVADYIDARGPASIAFVGSSMTRAGIAAPLVREMVLRETGRDADVANYGASSATIDETAAIIRYMIRRDALPDLLLIEVSPLQFRPSKSFRARKLAIFWSIEEWAAQWLREPSQAQRVLPVVIRRHIAAHWETFRYRRKLKYWAQERLGLEEPTLAPMAGHLPDNWQAGENLAASPPGRRAGLLRKWVEACVPGNRFPLSDALVDELADALELCQEADLPVVLYEMPLSADVRGRLPAGTRQVFHDIVRGLAARHNARFVAVEEFGVPLDDRDFADFSHMNQRGATRLTEALVRAAVLPEMRAE